MDDDVKLEDGKLLIYRRNGVWQARVYIGERRYLWRSLKTSNEADARKAGLRLFYQTEFKLTEGLPIHQRSLNSVIDEYVEWREKDNQQGKDAKRGGAIKFTQDGMLRQVQRVVKFWREYAGSRNIDSIDDAVLRGYVPWRKAYYHDMPKLPKNARLNPTDKTLQWEIMLGKALIKYAHDKGYRGNKPLPLYTYVPKVKRVRPAVSLGDFEKMLIGLQTELDAAGTDLQRRARQLMKDYVITLGLSGMRVGEANNLRIRDVEQLKNADGWQNVQFSVKGKTGQRVVVPHVDVRKVIDGILDRRKDAGQDDFLFVMPNGNRIINLCEQFVAFLDRIGVRKNGSGEPYTLYSLRHFYAVRALQRDIEIYTIARNMGTSVKMIEQYYSSHASNTPRARTLGGEEGVYSTSRRTITLEPTPEQLAKRAEKQRRRRTAARILEKGR